MKNIINKKLFFFILIIIVSLIVYKTFFNTNIDPKPIYTIDKVTLGDVVSALSVTGQVAMDSSIDVKSTVSGNINSIRVKPGDRVKTGDVLATIDGKTAFNTLKQAELSYNSANLAYKKSISKAATTTVISAQNTITNTQVSLSKAYLDAFDNISTTYLNMSSTLSSLNNSIYGTDLEKNRYNVNYYSDNIKAVEKNYNTNFGAETLYNNVVNQYNKTKKSYESLSLSYQSLNRESDSKDLYDNVVRLISVANEYSISIKNMINLVQNYHDISNKYLYDINIKSNTILSDLKNLQNTMNQNYGSLVDSKNTIDNLKSSLVEQNSKLNDLENGVSGLDLESAKLSLDQSLLNYQIAQTNYSNYFIKSPIDGIVGSINTSLGQDAGVNSVATIVSNGKFVNVSVSESDITKLALKQKVNLTFDAIDNLRLQGVISQISLIGTVSSGVVSYNVKVAFEDPKDIIRSGMSVTAKIETGSVKNVLRLPNSAIKSQIKQNYIQYFENENSLIEVTGGYNSMVLPARKNIELGLVGNDFTEIKLGLIENESVVIKIVNQTNSQTPPVSANNNSNRNTNAINMFGKGSK